MKVSFRENEKIQNSVSFTQEEMKSHKAKKHPVLKSFLVIVLLLSIALIGTMLHRKNIIYTHGIVAAAELKVKADDFDRIKSMKVEKGDQVKKGDVLFTQYSNKGLEKIKNLKKALVAKEKEYKKSAESKIKKLFENSEERFSNEMEILLLKQSGSGVERKSEITKATGKIKRLNVLLKSRSKRYQDLSKLFNLDAATRQQVEAAETNLQVIRDEHRLAVLLRGQLVKTSNLAKQEASEQRIKSNNANNNRLQAINTRLEQAQQADDALLEAIELIKEDLAELEAKYKVNEYLAPYDAVVTDVYANENTTFKDSDLILNIAAISKLWVDLYVKGDKANLLTKDKQILVYPEGSKVPIKGKLGSVGKIQLRVPPELQSKFTNVSSAVYFRIYADKNNELNYGNVVRVIVIVN